MKQYFVLFAMMLSFFTSGIVMTSLSSQETTPYLKTGKKSIVAPRGGVGKDGFKVPYRFEAALLSKVKGARKEVKVDSFGKKCKQF